MRFLIKFFTLILISKFALADSKVAEIAFEENDQVKIILTKSTDIKVFALDKPSRLVVDLKDSSLINQTKKILTADIVKDLRSSKTYGKLRLVFDLNNDINVKEIEKNDREDIDKSIITINIEKTPIENQLENQANDGQNNNQDLDFANFIINKVEAIGDLGQEKNFDISNIKSDNSQEIKPKSIAAIQKKPVIIIDAGHGGKDPGAIGRYARTKEKNLTLTYSKELYKVLKNTGKYDVYLTRKDDRFITLRNRVEIARKKKADLFISLHANSAGSRKVSGFSIYTLSEKSSDKEAEMLAQKENRAEILSGVNFSDASDDVVKMMISLSQRESMNSSARFAKFMVNSMKNSNIDVLNNTHRFAGFAVLTAPDMISVLVEIGYLTNYREEKKLNSYRYKRKIVNALVNGINQYFAKYK